MSKSTLLANILVFGAIFSTLFFILGYEVGINERPWDTDTKHQSGIRSPL
jgi:hypothetical protein